MRKLVAAAGAVAIAGAVAALAVRPALAGDDHPVAVERNGVLTAMFTPSRPVHNPVTARLAKSSAAAAAASTHADLNGDGADELIASGFGPFDFGNGPSLALLITVLYSDGGFLGLAVEYGGFSQRPGAITTGDFDGDGDDDLAVGASGGPSNTGGVLGGYVWALPGDPDPQNTFNNSLVISQDSAGVPGTAEADDFFGEAVAAGDINGDGRDDLAVGAPGEDTTAGADAGVTHVFWGNAGFLSGTGSVSISQDSAGVPGTAEPNDRFGSAVAVGHVTGDAFADLAVAANGENGVGSVFLVNGSAAGLSTTGNTSVGATGTTSTTLVGLGLVLAAADLTGDGLDEVIAGAPYSAVNGALGAGAIVQYLGRAAGLANTGRKVLSQASTGVPGTAEANDHFGTSLATGDLIGDDHVDVAVGAPDEGIGATSQAGAFAVLPGTASGLTGTGSVAFDQGSAGVPGTPEATDFLGFTLSVLFDGVAPYLVVAAHGEQITEDMGGTPSGMLSFFSDPGTGLAPEAGTIDGFDVSDPANGVRVFGYGIIMPIR